MKVHLVRSTLPLWLRVWQWEVLLRRIKTTTSLILAKEMTKNARMISSNQDFIKPTLTHTKEESTKTNLRKVQEVTTTTKTKSVTKINTKSATRITKHHTKTQLEILECMT